MFAWNQFLRITSTRSLYLIGAGASYPEIGLSNSLPNAVRNLVRENGIFEASVQPTSPLKSVILNPSSIIQPQDWYIAQEEFDMLTRPELVEVLVAQLLTRKEPIFPAQYRVFDLFYPSVLFNYNNDNLADKVHWKHEVHYPHGKINPLIAHSPFIQEAIHWLTIPLSVDTYFPYQRPIPEDSLITSTKPYRRLINIFSSIRRVCIIGYSFGRMNDAESFEMLIDLLRWKPKPILIVNPDPRDLIELLETTLKRKSVYGLSCKWNVLAKFVINGCFKRVYRISGGAEKLITNAYLYADESVENAHH